MADTVNVGGVNYSTDDITTLNGNTVAAGTNQTQRIKVQYGDDNTARDVSAAFPLPVALQDVASNGTMAALNATVLAATGGRGVTAVELTGTWVGTVSFQATSDPSGVSAVDANWYAVNAPAPTVTIPTSSTTTNGLFRINSSGYTAVRVRMTAFTSGTATAWINASGSNGMVTLAEPVTSGADPDTVVSGTLTATDAVNAAPAGTGGFASSAPTAGSYVALQCPGGDSSWDMQLTGTFGGGTVYFEASFDATSATTGNWVAVNGRQAGLVNTVLSTGSATAGLFRGNTSGSAWVRARIVGATTPSVGVTLRAASGVGAIFLNASVPAGTNTIGNVGIVASPSFVMTTGTLSAATVPSNPNTASTTSATVANVSSAGNVTVYLYGGTYTALTLAFEVSPDGTQWFGINASRMDGTGTDLTPSFTAATVRAWEIVMPGVTYFRVRATAITQTVAPTVVIAPGGIVYDPSPVVTGTVNVNPTGGTSVTPVGGTTAGQTPPASGGTGTISITSTAVVAATALIAAPAAGLSIYVTDMEGSNSGSTGTLVSLFEGTTNLRYARFMAASGGGFVTNLRTPWKLPAATAVGYAVSAATTSAFLTCSYFVAP